MAITYPLTMPSAPGFRDIRWLNREAASAQPSPFTYERKVYAWPGQGRMCTIELPEMRDATAKAWVAFFLSLRGPVGTFYLQDTVGKHAHGAVYGKGYVNGADQVGAELITDGWSPNTKNLFKAGDWVALSDSLYTVLKDVNSDASGNATLDIWPSLRSSPADDLEVKWGANARGIFAIQEIPEYGYDVSRLAGGFSFTAVEDI